MSLTVVRDSLFTTLSKSKSPLGIRKMAKHTGFPKKSLRAAMRYYEKNGSVVRVNPRRVGSGKNNLTLFCLPDNKFYA